MVQTRILNSISIDPEDICLEITGNDDLHFEITLSKEESDKLMFQLDVAKQEIDKEREANHETNIREGNTGSC